VFFKTKGLNCQRIPPLFGVVRDSMPGLRRRKVTSRVSFVLAAETIPGSEATARGAGAAGVSFESRPAARGAGAAASRSR
jgi:hypothetical protein